MPLFHNDRIFVIAEMANSHEGSLNLAKQITEKIALAGADAIKYQKFSADELAEPDHENYQLYKRLEMKNSDWSQLIKFAKKKKLKVFVDVFGLKSAKQISKYSVDGFKIHSSDLTNLQMLEYFSNSKKPILVSTSGSLTNAKIIQGNLYELIYLSSLIVSVFSSTMLDALCFNKPVIRVKFGNEFISTIDSSKVIQSTELSTLSENILNVLSDDNIRKEIDANRSFFIKDQYGIPENEPAKILSKLLEHLS